MTGTKDKSVEIQIAGKVQGVGFRYWTAQTARELGLTGWVRNEANGDVCARFAGPHSAVDAMIARCHSGPDHAKVESVEVVDEECTSHRNHGDFKILR